jgi:transposase
MSGNGTDRTAIPEPEVVPVAQRRRYSAAEKVRILEEADACTKPGEIGALLRREGLYSSHLTRWRRERDRGQLDALNPKRRGSQSSSDTTLAREVAKLQRENERLQARLDQAEAIIEVQKRLSQLLGPSPRKSEKEDRGCSNPQKR